LESTGSDGGDELPLPVAEVGQGSNPVVPDRALVPLRSHRTWANQWTPWWDRARSNCNLLGL